MTLIFGHFSAAGHGGGGALDDYNCISRTRAFVNRVTGFRARWDEHGPRDKTTPRRATMLSARKQLVAEVMTVIVLASATFFSVSPDSAATGPRHSGMITMAVQNSPELSQEQVRDFAVGD
jgi:hypothetical protein